MYQLLYFDYSIISLWIPLRSGPSQSAIHGDEGERIDRCAQ